MSAGYMRKCVGKIKYGSRKEAEGVRRGMAEAGRLSFDGSNSYRCNQCGSYHIGHALYRGRKPGRKGKGKK